MQKIAFFCDFSFFYKKFIDFDRKMAKIERKKAQSLSAYNGKLENKKGHFSLILECPKKTREGL